MRNTAPVSALLLTALGVNSLRSALCDVRTSRRGPRKIGPDVVVADVDMTLLDERDGPTVVHADLIFDPLDPYAVTAVFRAHAQRVTWTFGRELLAQGLYAPVGEGDVHVWPCVGSSGAAVVVFELGSPDGDVMLQAESSAITRFVQQMLIVVPNGRETAFVDLDVELDRILSDQPAAPGRSWRAARRDR